MRIKSVEYENFRNFKERGKIECSTDQKVTIIYGRNGDGKTTFHQLFQCGIEAVFTLESIYYATYPLHRKTGKEGMFKHTE